MKSTLENWVSSLIVGAIVVVPALMLPGVSPAQDRAPSTKIGSAEATASAVTLVDPDKPCPAGAGAKFYVAYKEGNGGFGRRTICTATRGNGLYVQSPLAVERALSQAVHDEVVLVFVSRAQDE